MKNILTIASAIIVTVASAFAGDDHNVKATPNGGKLITNIQPHAEFFVTPDRKVKITFVDETGKTIAPADQVVTVTTGDRSAPTKLSFTKSGDFLISDVAIPDGGTFPTVLQIQSAPDQKAEIAKFNLNLATCPGCQKAEYACTCNH